MQIRFWGVRGSLPAPLGSEEIRHKLVELVKDLHSKGGIEKAVGTVDEEHINAYLETLPRHVSGTYGGNTSCVEVTTASGEHIVLDAGSGIRKLGSELASNGTNELLILLSHLHWDHIQGFPFFAPAYIPGRKLELYGEHKENGANLESQLRSQMSYPSFPVSLDSMPSGKEFHELTEGAFARNGTRVSYARLNHPQGVLSYRIEDRGKSMVYATDNEHDSFGRNDSKLIGFAKAADVLVYDGQYSPEEYEPERFGIKKMSRVGWGHSTYERGIDIAIEAGVKELILFHHEPAHNDRQLFEIEQRAKEYLRKKQESGAGLGLNVSMAYEGMEVRL